MKNRKEKLTERSANKSIILKLGQTFSTDDTNVSPSFRLDWEKGIAKRRVSDAWNDANSRRRSGKTGTRQGAVVLSVPGSLRSARARYADRFILRDSIVDGRQTLQDARNGLHQGQMKVFPGRCSMPSCYKHASKQDSRKSSPPRVSFSLLFPRAYFRVSLSRDVTATAHCQRICTATGVGCLSSCLLFLATFSFALYSRSIASIRDGSEGRPLKVVSCDRQRY